MKLEELQPDATVRGIQPEAAVTVVRVDWHGSDAVTLVYRGPEGRVADEILYRHDEPRLTLIEAGRPWSFDGDGALFRLVSEAHRIRLAHLFDPVLAVHTSLVDPLPHQITAVYEAMLDRQPLRFLLADDPGAGKTIMAGLLIKELIARGDLKRCLVVCPGSLAEQWQDELHRRFHLPFEILTNDKLEAARTGNWFLENDLAIARLDKLSRNEDVQRKLAAPDCRWDLVVCDEAHKLSATFFGGEVKYTKRYRLGQLLSGLTRHFLLMTATPHNGKEQDFQLFLALLDGDRFEGRFRDGVHQVEVSDLMRRMVKESLLKFDGTPLFPERIAYTRDDPARPVLPGTRDPRCEPAPARPGDRAPRRPAEAVRRSRRMKILVDANVLADFCQRHAIRKLSLFGSVLKHTDRPDSDVDLLVEFEAGKKPGLLALAAIEDELSDLLGGRRVDLRTAEDLSRYFRDEVVRTAEVQYARR